MTTKRKTQLNLSGSHRNVDADIVFVGSNLFVTGSAQFTGSVNVDDVLSASGDLSTAGAFFVQGATQLTGAVNLASTLSASGQVSTQGGLRVQGATQLTGALNLAAGLSASGNITAAGIFSGSTGRFTYLSGALSASSTGQPFIVAGSNVTTTFSPTDLNWTIAATGGGGSVAGSDTQVQFNQNGAFAASSSLTHFSGTLGVQALSGSLTSSGTVFADTFQYNGNILKIASNVLVTQSVMIFEGIDPTVEVGGVVLTNGAGLSMFSGSATGPNSPLAISPAVAADSVDVNIKGSVIVRSGSLAVNSGSASDSSFTVEPSTTAKQVNVIFDRTGSTGGVNFAGINVRPLYSFQDDTTGVGFLMPGDLLSAGNTGNNSIGKIDFNVIAVSKDSNNYASWTFSTTVAKNIAGTTVLVGIPTELDSATSGSDAATWDVNVNGNATIACTGSALAATNPIKWYAQITKKMFVSGSGLITY